ncbi:uncharacterized protein LOC134835376 [Culicoides brevitarsis]|uniref:uncharacterized protein LOC134835376 n=1 Tax=Culicoides brevitarsis TaxID=469753 RepID=UPI00307C64F8
MTCRLKVTRETPTGLVYLKFYAMNVSDIKLHFMMFFRYTGGFKPYLLDITFDICEFAKHTAALLYNEFLKRFALVITKEFSDILRGCPYNGKLETSWVDSNASFSSVLPPVFPTGRYKMAHWLIWKNKTAAYIEFQCDLKAKREFRATDFSMLNMG